MRKLVLLMIAILGIGCTSLDLQDRPQEQETVLPLPSPPARYRVVLRDRSAWVDPAFAAIERRWEYLLEEKEPRRRWTWERDSREFLQRRY